MNIRAEQEIKDSFSIRKLGKDDLNEGQSCQLFYHQILLVEKGGGVIEIDGREFRIKDRMVLLMVKHQKYTYKRLRSLSGYQVSFGDCFWEKSPASAHNCKAILFNDVTTHQQLAPSHKAFEELVPLFENLYTDFQGEEYPNKLDALAAYLKIIMIKTANINSPLADAYNDFDYQSYNTFLELVSKHYTTSREVSEYAAKLNISPRKLTMLCSRYSGKSAKTVINEKVVTEAKRLLQFHTVNVKEIAYGLNFHTPEQFSHFFKQHTGISPLYFRETYVQIGM